jgi:MFS family permease
MTTEAVVLSESSSPSLRFRLQPWVVCFSAALFFFFIFIQINMFNAVDPYLIASFHVNAEQLGQISAGYFYGNVTCLLFAGVLLDRFSTRRVILVTMTMSVIGALGFALSHSFWQALSFRVLIGFGGAFCFLCCVRLVSRWFPPRKMAFVIGLIVTVAMMGGMVAQTPMTVLTHAVGWRHALLMDAFLGVLMLGLMMFFVKDAPEGYNLADQQAHASSLGLLKTITLVMRNRQNWLAGIYTSMVNLPIFLFGALWGVMYLVQIHHLGRADAGLVTMMLFVGIIFGSPVFGWLSDRIRHRKGPMMLGAVVSLGLLLLIMYVPHLSFDMLSFLFFALGFMSGAQVLGYPLVAESNPISFTGTAEGLASTIIMAGGLTQPVFGWMMDLRWNHKMLHHLPVYSVGDFNFALMIMPVAMLIAIVVTVLAKETHCRHQKAD